MKVLIRIISYFFDPVDHNISGNASQKSVNFFSKFPWIAGIIAAIIVAIVFVFHYVPFGK